MPRPGKLARAYAVAQPATAADTRRPLATAPCEGDRDICRVAAGHRLVEFGSDVPPRPLVLVVRRQMLVDNVRTPSSVDSVINFGITSGRGGGRDQFGRTINDAAPCRDRSSPERAETLLAAHRRRQTDCKLRTACPLRTRAHRGRRKAVHEAALELIG
jgi:hypothetical protein